MSRSRNRAWRPDKGRVLVLDGDPAVVSALAAAEELLTVHTASSPFEAWFAFQRQPFEVIVSDHDHGRGLYDEFLVDLAGRAPAATRIVLTSDARAPRIRRLSATAERDGLLLIFRKPMALRHLISWVLIGVTLARLARCRRCA